VKAMRRNMRLIVAIVMCLFVGLFAYFSYSVYFYGGRWFNNPYNPRLNTQRQAVRPGTVMDRDGEPLAFTDSGGTRRYARDNNTRRAVSHVIGDNAGNVNGVETFHAQYLLGFKTSILERLAQVFQGGERRGDDIYLTLSAKLNTYISRNFPSGRSGAVVILNYRTGDIYAMVSKPDFDPNRIDVAKREEGGSSLLNRATQGLYPPGSTFKIVTQAAALNNLPNARSRPYDCSGALEVEKSVVTEAGNNVHGNVTLQEAFAKSCNVTYSQLALELGYDRMNTEAAAFGLGDNFLFRDLVVYNSIYPTDKRSADDLAWSGLGQGRVLVTPLHMAMTAACIANNGVMVEPRLLRQVTGPQGQRRLLGAPRPYRTALSPETAAALRADMVAAVSTGSTGSGARIRGFTVGGKTGSAEAADDKTIQPHAWFVGFVDDPNHPLAIAVLVEFSGSGGQVAAPLARRFLQRAIDLGL